MFEQRGEFFATQEGASSFRKPLPLPKDVLFRRVEVEFDVFIAGWNPTWPRGFHGLLALLRGKGGDQNIYLASDLRGGAEGRPPMAIVYSDSLRGENEEDHRASVPWQIGNWYNIRYTLDFNSRQLSMQVHQDNQLVKSFGGYIPAATPIQYN